jgi:hypothetical protein
VTVSAAPARPVDPAAARALAPTLCADRLGAAALGLDPEATRVSR